MQRSKYKIDLIGPQGSGKTSIAKRLVYNEFEEEYSATVGSDAFYDKEGFILRDHSADPRYTSISERVFNRENSDAIILVLDGSKTFTEQEKDIRHYLGLVEIKNTGKEFSEKINFYVMINKIDLEQKFGDKDEQQLRQLIGSTYDSVSLINEHVFKCSAQNQGREQINHIFQKIRAHLTASNKEKVEFIEPVVIDPKLKEKGASFLQSIRNAFEPIIDHPVWAGGNGLIAVGAVTLFALAAFTAGSFLTFGILPSAFLGAAIIAGAALVAWNAICYGIDKYQKNSSRKVEVDLTADYNSMEVLGGQTPDVDKRMEVITPEQGPSPVTPNSKAKNPDAASPKSDKDFEKDVGTSYEPD